LIHDNGNNLELLQSGINSAQWGNETLSPYQAFPTLDEGQSLVTAGRGSGSRHGQQPTFRQKDAGGFEQIGIAHINTSLSALGQWNRNQPILDPNQGEVSTERNVAPSDRARLSELARQAELSNRQRAVAFTAMRYPSLAVST